jgi:hypothetical protein
VSYSKSLLRINRIRADMLVFLQGWNSISTAVLEVTVSFLPHSRALACQRQELSSRGIKRQIVRAYVFPRPKTPILADMEAGYHLRGERYLDRSNMVLLLASFPLSDRHGWSRQPSFRTNPLRLRECCDASLTSFSTSVHDRRSSDKHQ